MKCCLDLCFIVLVYNVRRPLAPDHSACCFTCRQALNRPKKQHSDCWSAYQRDRQSTVSRKPATTITVVGRCRRSNPKTWRNMGPLRQGHMTLFWVPQAFVLLAHTGRSLGHLESKQTQWLQPNRRAERFSPISSSRRHPPPLSLLSPLPTPLHVTLLVFPLLPSSVG